MEPHAEDIVHGGVKPSTIFRVIVIGILASILISSHLYFLYEIGNADKTVIESSGPHHLYEGEEAPGITDGMYELTNKEQEFIKSNERRIITNSENKNYPNLVGKASPETIRTENSYYRFDSHKRSAFEWLYFLLLLPALIIIGAKIEAPAIVFPAAITFAISIPYFLLIAIIGTPY